MKRQKQSIARHNTPSILHHWHEAVANERLAYLVKYATRTLLRALQMRLNAHSVSLGHWTFLRILWEGDGLTQRELSERAGLTEPTTFFALKTMEKVGYITRRHTPENRKNIIVFLTPIGRRLKSKLVPLAEEVNQVAVHGVSLGNVATMRQTLLTIIENLARDENQSIEKNRRIPSTRELALLVSEANKTRGLRPRKRALG